MKILNKSLFCLFMVFIVIGCANQQKEDTKNASVEEVSLSVNGMV